MPVQMMGELGIPLVELPEPQRQWLRSVLTLKAVAWNEDDPPQTVQCFREDGTHFWLPRYFEAARFWHLVETWNWTLGAPAQLSFCGQLDPERGQIQAVAAMVQHLQQNSAGLLVAPTGTGKSCMGLAVSAKFGRAVGIPVYAGHMVDHWVSDAMKFLGLSRDDIGLVQRDQCELGRPVTIMMIESLLARTYPKELYEQIGFLIADEAPRFGAPLWKDVAAMFPARYRLGLSADPTRRDGLGQLISWLLGDVGHEAKRVRTVATKAPTVVGVRLPREYPPARYFKWKRSAHDPDQWVPDVPNPVKYDALAASDEARSDVIAREVVAAAQAGRHVLVFSSRVQHLQDLRRRVRQLLDPLSPLQRLATLAPPDGVPTVGTLSAGLDANERAVACGSDVIFATFAMARDALDVPRLDTEFFATQPGNPLQPVGRLREKADGLDRKPLLIVEFFEESPYSQERWRSHRGTYRKLGMTVQEVSRVLDK